MKLTNVTFAVSLSAVLGCSGGGGGGDDDDADALELDAAVPSYYALTFDLDLVDQAGAPRPAHWIIAVRSSDGALVHYESHENDGGDGDPSFQRTIPAILQRGVDYQIGISASPFIICEQSYGDVWFEELLAVGENATIARSFVHEEGRDRRGCDVMHEPLALEPGRYESATPILGSGQYRIALVVSETGRLYVEHMFVLCEAPPEGCYPSLKTLGPTCDAAVTPPPGEPSVTLGASSNDTTLRGEVTFDPRAGLIHYDGAVTSYASPFDEKPCCSDPVVVDLTRTGTGAAPEECL